MDKKDNIFLRFKNSLFNIAKFPMYIRYGLGSAIIYALILSIICGSIGGISNVVRINNSINEVKVKLVDSKNEFVIENGILSIDNSPVKVEENNLLIYIDDNKSMSDLDELKSVTVHENSAILILKDGISLTSELVEPISSNYSQIFGSEKVTNKTLVEGIDFFEKMMSVTLVLINLVQTFITLLMELILISSLAMISASIIGVRLRFSELFSLAIYSSTLPMIVVTILTTLMPNVYFNSVGSVGTILLTLFALIQIRKNLEDNRNVQ